MGLPPAFFRDRCGRYTVSKYKKDLTEFSLPGFMVAEAGFEPTTFGL
jgi:hypothetical protein